MAKKSESKLLVPTIHYDKETFEVVRSGGGVTTLAKISDIQNTLYHEPFREIIFLIQRYGKLSINDIAKSFQRPYGNIHRQLKKLEKRGILSIRTYRPTGSRSAKTEVTTNIHFTETSGGGVFERARALVKVLKESLGPTFGVKYKKFLKIIKLNSKLTDHELKDRLGMDKDLFYHFINYSLSQGEIIEEKVYTVTDKGKKKLEELEDQRIE